MEIALSRKLPVATIAAATPSLSRVEAAESTVRIALGDVTSVEQAAFLVASKPATEEFP